MTQNEFMSSIFSEMVNRLIAQALQNQKAGWQLLPQDQQEAQDINIPSALEQTEIVRILDNLLAKEQQAKEAAEGVLEQIDLIKKAILARAFHGELGTNDPSEESAISLLP